MALLPDHGSEIDASVLWVDLAGHLANIWRHVIAAAEAAHGQPIPTEEWNLPEVDAALEAWRSSDLLYAAFEDLGAAERETP
jgi:hypothetical protein